MSMIAFYCQVSLILDKQLKMKKLLTLSKRLMEKIIGAISIAPIFLVQAGMLCGKAFMIRANKEELLEEDLVKKILNI